MSSIDAPHFGQARRKQADPADQMNIPHPRLGFFGVIDERMDLELLSALAQARPDWHLVMLGPVVKIDPENLPKLPNLHYLGMKTYDQLPGYLGNWDIALLPFALNDSTRFISPTKIPEYLAGGKPVVSTPIQDVINPYGKQKLVSIAGVVDEFVQSIEDILQWKKEDTAKWLTRVDQQLSQNSWDYTWKRMMTLIESSIAAREKENKTILKQSSSIPSIPVYLDLNQEGEAGVNGNRRSGKVQPFDYLIVGAGFAGSVLAERLAAGSGKKVLLVDRRPHIGGNAYDMHDDAGILVHKYGPHIFHTNPREVFEYLTE